jgi:predicted outer membrane repeat protein
LFLIFSIMLAACENPFMADILGRARDKALGFDLDGSDGDGDSGGQIEPEDQFKDVPAGLYLRTDMNDPKDFSVLEGNNVIEQAISFVKEFAAQGDEFILLVDDDVIQIAPQSIASPNFNLSIHGHNSEKTIRSSGAEDIPLFTINNSSAILTLEGSLTLQGRTDGFASLVKVASGTLTIKEGSKITGHTNANTDAASPAGTGAVSVSGKLIMEGGSISGTVSPFGDVVALQNASVELSGDAAIGTLTLNSSAGGNSKVEINSAWGGGVDGLNLMGNSAALSGTGGVISLWEGKTILYGEGLDAASISQFKLGNFVTQSSPPEIKPISDTHYIEDTGADIGKLVALYDLQAEVDKYSGAANNMTIAVPRNFPLKANINVPAPANPNAVLTITSAAGGPYTATRGFADDNWYSGLFIVTSGAKLAFENIIVDGNKANYSANKGSLVMINPDGDFTLKNGAVLRNNAVASPGPGGAVNVTGNREDGSGAFTMSGGEISGNTANFGGGVNIVGNGASFMMSGGTISGNTAAYGGGVYVDETSNFKMSGGEISENTASNNGGGACSFNADGFYGGSIQISGTAKISGNTAGQNGGGIYAKSDTTLFGSVVISGNTAGQNGGGTYIEGRLIVGGAVVINGNTVSSTANNVYLFGDTNSGQSYIVLGDNYTTPVPAPGMNIGVRTAEDYNGATYTGGIGLIAEHVTEEVAGYFHADEDGKVLLLNKPDLYQYLVITSQTLLDFYEQVAAFATAASNRTITVSENMALWRGAVEIPQPANANATLTIQSASGTTRSLAGTFVVPNGAKLVFQNIELAGSVTINGGKFTQEYGAAISGNVMINGGEYTLKDGAAQGNYNGYLTGVYIDGGGIFTMTGGTIKNNRALYSKEEGYYGGGGVNVNNGTFTMTGGEINDHLLAASSGNTTFGAVFVGANGSFTMSGSAEINGNTIRIGIGSGSTVSVDGGTFTMSGGTISGNDAVGVVVGNGGTFNMSGGTISGNINGGVSVGKDAVFTVGGTAVVKENTSSSATASNVYLYVENSVQSYITLGTGSNGAPAPATGMNIGVRTASDHDDVIVASGANATIAGYFKADEAGKSIGYRETGGAGQIVIFDVVDMLSVAGGMFMMGSLTPVNTAADETQHQVTLTTGFSIAKYQVTQKQYETVMTGNGNGINPTPSRFKSDPVSGENQNRRPVEQVSWYEAIVFCNRLSIMEGLTPAYIMEMSAAYDFRTDPDLWGTVPAGNRDARWDAVEIVAGSTGYRLPTEAQWEYAARGGASSGGYNYSGSGDIDAVAWHGSNSGSKSREVGKKQPNELGLYDMSGNVWEWCWDWYDDYPIGPQTDPTGPATAPPSTGCRVIRGGGWKNEEGHNIAWRGHNIPPQFKTGDDIGFRVVRPVQ